MDNVDYILTRYLDGELTAPEKEKLEEELLTNQSLKDELESLRLAREAVRLYGLKQQVGTIHAQMMKELPRSKQKIHRVGKAVRYVIAIAASVLLIVGAYVIYNFVTLSSDKVYASKYQSYELATFRDGETTESATEKAFRAKNYRKVIQLSASGGVKEKFLCGVSSMELKDNTSAIECFNAVLEENIRTKKQTFQDETEYYLALTYIRNKDYDLALDLLSAIHNDPEHLYNEKVTGKLLRQVRMLKWK